MKTAPLTATSVRHPLRAVLEHGDEPGGEPHVGAAPITDRAVMHIVEAHLASERDMIAEYRAIVRDAHDAPVRFLAGLILSDEERHHALLGQMLNQYRTIDDGVERAPRVPYRTAIEPPRGFSKLVRTMRKRERDDLRDFRRLRRLLRKQRVNSLNLVVLDVLMADTRKHMRLLRALERLPRRHRLRRRPV
jgi:rubrerythrin